MIRCKLFAVALLLVACSALFAQTPTTPDGFPLPPGAIHRFGNRQARHPEAITASAVSSDGKYIATLGSSCIVVWDAKTLTAKCVLNGPMFGSYGFGDRNAALRFYPDSKSLLVTVRPTDRTSISVDETVELAQVWDLEASKMKFGLKGKWSWASGAWLVDGGKEIAMQSDYRENAVIRYFDGKTGKELRSVKTPMLNRGAWVAPLGHRMAVPGVNGAGMTVMDTKTGEEVYRIAGSKMVQAAITPDAKKLLYHDEEGKVHVHDLETKMESFAFNHPAQKQRGPMIFSKDQQTLYFGGQYGQLFRWDLKNNKPMPDVGKHSTWTLSTIALNPDESILYSMGGDKIIKQWDLKTLKQLPVPDGYTTQTAVVPTIDGKNLIIVDHAGKIDYWDLATGKHIKQVQPGNTGGINCVAVSNDGRWFAGGRTLQDVTLWDLNAGKPEKLFGLVENPDPKGSDHVQRVFFRPDGKVLFTTSRKTGLTAWSVPDAKRLWHVDGIGPHAACDPKGRWIAINSESNDELVQWTLLDANTWQVVRRIDVPMDEVQDQLAIQYPPYLSDFAFTPDGSRVLTAHFDGIVRVWNPETGVQIVKFGSVRTARNTGFSGLACSPDGKLVGVGQADRKISIWELATNKEVLVLAGHESNIRDVAFTRDGKGIIGNADLSPVLWSITPSDLPKLDMSADAMWNLLASDDSAKAYRLVWALARDPKTAVKMFSERIKPSDLTISREQFDKWVANLDSPQFRTREAAEKNLLQAGLKAPIGWLRQAIAEAKGDEVIARLQRVLVQREKPDPDEWRLARAVQTLSFAGTDETKALLRTWADAGGSGLAFDAKTALERLR